MRIAIVGAGGVGGLLGGLLTRAGNEVALLARGAHLEAIRREGLRVTNGGETFTVHPAGAADDPAALGGSAEAILVCVKTWQLPELAPKLSALVGPATVVIPTENGVTAADELAKALGEGPVLGGTCDVSAWVEGPGRIRQRGKGIRLVVGERRGGASARVERVCGVLRAAGIEAEATGDVDAALWRKFLFIEPWGSIGAVTRASVGVVRTLPETRALLTAAIQELLAVARARGVRLSDNVAEDTLHRIGLLPPDATSSMQRDIQAGRPSELHDQTGAALRLAREAGVTAPVHGFLYAALLPQESVSRSSGVQRQ